MLGSPPDHLILEGIRVGLLQELCADTGTPCQIRRITRPRSGSVAVSVNGVAQATGWTLGPLGMVQFAAAPAAGAVIRAGFLFDVPVRFEQDRLDISGLTFMAGEAPSVPLIEVREAV